MEILVTYDMAVTTAAGRRRLRRVAKACQAFGQRVQQSVFECTLNAAQFEQLKHRLLMEVKPEEDSLRFYRLREPYAQYLQVVGRRQAFDLRGPFIL